jgi:VanZ family protein
MAVLFAVSHASAPPGISLVPDWASHGLAYALLGLLCHRALRGRPRAALLAVALSTAYGITDEVHQSFVPGRHAEWADVAKDFGGSLIGATLYGAWLTRLARPPA